MKLRNNFILNNAQENLCLGNFYTLEILESLGISTPSQKQIDKAEVTLASAKSIADAKLAPYLKINTINPDNVVLIIESNQQLSLLHQILFLNFGFFVDHSTSYTQSFIKPSPYKAIFIFDNPKRINSLFIRKCISRFFKENQPYVCIVTDENNLTANKMNNFLRQSVNEILPFPLSLYKLRKTLEKISVIESQKR